MSIDEIVNLYKQGYRLDDIHEGLEHNPEGPEKGVGTLIKIIRR